MKKEMLINVLQQEECRIAIVEDGVLEELYVERASQESYVGNIYKGRIVNIEPSIQAAFVDFGIGRNGFLHISDVDPAYYKHLLSKADLAEYEADQDREFGGGGGGSPGRSAGPGRDRGGDRGPRDRAPRQPTAWLDPQPLTPPARGPVNEEVGDFASGLDDEQELPEAEEVMEAELVEKTDEFDAGVADQPPVVREAPKPVSPHPRPARAPAPPAPPEADDEFGAGLFDDSEPTPAAEPEHFPNEATEATEATEGEVAEVAGDAETKQRKPRSRRAKPKADEPAAEAKAEDEPAVEGKGKAKGRRTRKKADDGGEDGEEPGPKLMGGAERRTTGDDEPEIQPFFDSGSDDFDPDAPNDRFGDGVEDDAPPGATAEDDEPEPAEAAEAEVRGFEKEERGPEPVHTGRGFNDDFDSGRPERNDRGGGGRDRDRGRGGRDRGPDRGPPRGRPSDRDRGPGGGRDRGPGGPRGGPRGGPKGGRDRGIPKPAIQDVFKRGQEVIVQVIKEGIGTKGPTLSTYISIAGRYLVLMPSLNRFGVSRKIEDHEARRRLREIMSTLCPPKGVGFIVRTAAIDRDARELQNDLAYLLRLWQVVVKRIKRVNAPVEIYRESDMITRTIRDIFTSDIDTIWVDEEQAFSHASEFLQIVMPRYASRIKYFGETEPLFHKYAIEDEIAKIHQKRIEMPLGGSLVIEQTEALVAIDVNSGNFRADNNAEETAYQMNLHAAREIARQLRLRDLGGVIVNDFIDMRGEAHRRGVETALRDAMRRDRARTKILRISQFGLIEMTRQRIRPSLKRSIFADCSHCRGTGFVKNNESMSIEVMRTLQLAAHRKGGIQSVEVTTCLDVANYLLNKKRKEITGLEERGKMEVRVIGQSGVSPDTFLVKCHDANGNEVRIIPPPAPRLAAGRIPRGHDREPRRFPQPLD